MAQPISNIASGISIDTNGNVKKSNTAAVNGLMSIFPKTGGSTIKSPTPTINTPLAQSLRSSIAIAPGGSVTSPTAAPVASGGYNNTADLGQPFQVRSDTLQTPTTAVKGILPTPTPTGTSFGGLVGNIATASNPSGSQTGLLKELTQVGRNNDALANQAASIGNLYGGKIAEVGRLGAGAQAGDLSTGTNVVGSGNAAIASQSASQRMSALAADEQQALGAVDRQITANGQQANALNAALGGANTQQAQTISGLNSAASLSQPQVTSFGQTSFNPVSGQFDGGGSLPPEVMQQYAQMAATGQYNAIPSFITSNPVLNAQLNAGAQAINPNYTPIGAAGASQVLSGIPQLTSANTAAEGIKNTIQSYLQQNPTLNATDLAAGNLLQQWIQGKQMTDPKYQTLFNYLNEYTNTLAPILGVGGDPTNLKTQIAQGFINAAASGASISQVLNSMSSLATNKIQDLQSGALGQGTNVPAPSSGSNFSTGFAETW